MSCREYQQLMLAMPTQLKNLVNDQINSINATINKRGRETLKERYPQGAQDPCAKYCRYLTLFRHA